MSQFGCYTLDRLYCTCGDCAACKHRALMEGEEKAKQMKKGVGKAIDGFFRRVRAGKYNSPEDKKEKAKQRFEDERRKEDAKQERLWRNPELFPRGP